MFDVDGASSSLDSSAEDCVPANVRAKSFFSRSANVVNAIQSSNDKIREKAAGTHHLIGIARK